MALLLALAGAACSGEKKGAAAGATGGGEKSATTAPFDALALASEPAGAKPLGEVIAAQQGSGPVVARGRVGEDGGGSSWFTLVDPSLKSCVEIGDECKTPWDYCCTPNDVKKQQMANVELRVGGELVEHAVLGWRGLDHLKEVVVAGQATKDGAGNVTIVASGIWVKP
jgi:hypothetical protein